MSGLEFDWGRAAPVAVPFPFLFPAQMLSRGVTPHGRVGEDPVKIPATRIWNVGPTTANWSVSFPFFIMQTLPVLETDIARISAASASLPSSSSLGAATSTSGSAGLVPARRASAANPMPPILVADDDPDDTFFIDRLIRRTGVKNPVRTFDDGTEVVNYLGSARLASPGGRLGCPTLLFLDLKMRGLGGFGFLEWARREKGLGPLTIVVLSSANETEIVARALELGAHRYLVKYPCLQTINTIVRSVYPQTVF
jgi:CheY-like chemotaxis protein